MSSFPVISVRNIGKKYRLGFTHEGKGYKTLRDTIAHGVKRIVQGAKRIAGSGKLLNNPITQLPNNPQNLKEFWALKDITFDVQQGEVVGIIGRNGAGKSTLLKILSEITEPTEGEIRIRGRVASLLEVGTGFHPELSGRENVYMNGAILGMTKAEIDAKFDEIVAFSGVERFIDTPVKRYSSGMNVRLAFAVAAYLEPEVLLVDEVLAVGDAAFQKKCLGKMADTTKEGRTVLFVSHNMHSISLLCSRIILLQNGKVTDQGPARRVIEHYLSLGTSQSAEAVWSFKDAPGTKLVKLHSVRAFNEEGESSNGISIAEPVTLQMDFWCLRRTGVTVSFHIYTQQGIMLFSTANLHDNVWGQMEYHPGLYRCSCVIPGHLLNEGKYYVHAYLSRDTDGMPYVRVPEVVSFQIIDDGTARGNYVGGWPGAVRPVLPWTGRRLGELP